MSQKEKKILEYSDYRPLKYGALFFALTSIVSVIVYFLLPRLGAEAVSSVFFLCIIGLALSVIVLVSNSGRVDFPTTGDKESGVLLSIHKQAAQDSYLLKLIGSPLLTYDDERHLITFAPNGSGKFTNVQAPVLLSLDRSIFVIDPKGQAAAVTARRRREMGQKVVFLNPFGLHGLPQNTFNPLAALDPFAPSFLADVSRLVDGLIDQTGKDPFWPEAARDLVSWLIMWTVLYEEEKTLGKVRDLLCQAPAEFLETAKDAALSEFPPLRNKAASFDVEQLTPTLQSVIKTAQTETRIFDDPLIRESLSGEDFDFSELKRQKITVFLILPADYLALYSKWLRVLLMSAMSAMYRRHDGERVLFLLDEFAQLGYLYDLEKAAGLARGYRVQLWPFFQDLNQLKTLYGDRWETFLANAGVIQVFAPNDLTTASYFEKRNNEDPSRSQGKALGAESFIDLEAEKQVIFRNGKRSGILLDKTRDYYENPDFAGMFDPDPFHLAE